MLLEQSGKIADLINENALLYGNKSANLIVLNDILPGSVPAFLPLESDSLYNHLNQYSGNRWTNLLKEFQDIQGEEKTHIRQEALPILEQLRKEIIETFKTHPIENEGLQSFLSNQKDSTLMVRSTGEEDTVDLANPGGNESMAAVAPNIAAVSLAMGYVVASYFSEKSLKQRLLSPQNDITKKAFIPVLIQQMIGEQIHGFDTPDKVIRSGVMYTGEAFTRIQVAPGHGELVVNSQGLFDTFSVTRENMVYPEIRTKKYRLVPSEDGLQLKKNSESLQKNVSISLDVAQQLAEMGRKIEAYYGMPMDVEFVYDPQDKKISIVQARPIPAGKDKTIVPSSIPPEKMSELKKHINEGKIGKQDAQVITPAGFHAQIINDPAEILVCNTISDALNVYLKQSAPSPIKAVVVQHLSPPNSHEAAQFNLMGIPVLQINNLAIITEWASEKPLLMIDPQRSQILNLKTFMPESRLPEEELKTQGLLTDGLFTHPMKPVTIVPLSIQTDMPVNSGSSSARLVDAIQSNPAETLKDMFSRIKVEPLDRNNIYKQLLDNIEILEAAPNEDASLALSQVRYAILKFNQKYYDKHANLFPQMMIACEEIERSMNRLADNASQKNVNLLREEHLALVSQLKSLVSFPGVRDTFSTSIKQMMQEKKSEQSVVTNGLDSEQVDYITQFLKLNKIAFTEKSRERWTHFVKACVEHREAIPVLADVVKFYVDNKLESNLINTDLRKFQLTTLKSSPLSVLNQLFKNCKQAKEEFSTIQLEKHRNTITAWEQRIYEWENPEQFDTLWREFQVDIVPLIDQLTLNTPSGLTPTTEQSILKLALSLTDMMDATIKSLKRNPESLEQPELLIERFITLLKPYNKLMANWINAVPDASISNLFKHAASTLRDDLKQPDIYKKNMIESANKVLGNDNREIKQLTSSNRFSVAAAKMGSSANFKLQFMDKIDSITLEDLFSFMHQNILASLNLIQQDRFPIDMEALPGELQPLLHRFNDSKLNLLSVRHEFPTVSLDYNLAMRSHSASFTFEYNQLTKKTILHGDFFGSNGAHRMDYLVGFLKCDANVLNAAEVISPSYSADNSNLHFSWELPGDNLEVLSSSLLENFLFYDQLLVDALVGGNCMEDRFKDFFLSGRADLIKTMEKAGYSTTLKFTEEDIQMIVENLPQLPAIMNNELADKKVVFSLIGSIVERLYEIEDVNSFLNSIDMLNNLKTENDIRLLFDHIRLIPSASLRNTFISYLLESQNGFDYSQFHQIAASDEKYANILNGLKKLMPEEFSKEVKTRAPDYKSALKEQQKASIEASTENVTDSKLAGTNP